jgi:hypothetical protein
MISVPDLPDEQQDETSMAIKFSTRNTNWWGLLSTVTLFVWFLFWFKDVPQTLNGEILFWGTLALIHLFGIKAAMRRFGWVYLVPLSLLWIVVIVALSGGIPQ